MNFRSEHKSISPKGTLCRLFYNPDLVSWNTTLNQLVTSSLRKLWRTGSFKTNALCPDLSLFNHMNLELDEHQTKLAIAAFEELAFTRCKQATEFRQRNLHIEAGELFFLASKCRQAIGWPRIDDGANQNYV